MFHLTIATRDFITISISGSRADLMTTLLIMRSGLQARQRVTIAISRDDQSGSINLPNVHQMVDAAETIFNALER